MKEQHIIALNIYKRTQQLVFSLKCQKFLINLCYKMYQHDRKPISSIWRVCGTILSPNTHRAPTSEHKACVRCYKHSCVLRFQALILKHPPIQNPLSLFFSYFSTNAALLLLNFYVVEELLFIKRQSSRNNTVRCMTSEPMDQNLGAGSVFHVHNLSSWTEIKRN